MIAGGFGLVLDCGVWLGVWSQAAVIVLEYVEVGCDGDVTEYKWMLTNVVLLIYLLNDCFAEMGKSKPAAKQPAEP